MVGGSGAVWGLGLARLIAEGGFWTFFYTSPLAAALTALVCAAFFLALWRLLYRPPLPRRVGLWAAFLPLALPLLYVTGLASGSLAGAALLVGGAGLTVVAGWSDRPSWLLPALLALVSLAVYGSTLLPSVGEADTLEFQVVAAKLGVAHPTGYPLYVLLGKLFTLLPVRNVAWRVNAASAVFGAAAVVMVSLIVRRLTEGGSLPRFGGLLAFLTALALAFSPTFWSQAVVAEVYTLHNLLAAAILWLLLRPAAPGDRRDRGSVRRWHAVAFLLGLSLTNHLTTVLLLPAAGLAFFWNRTRWGLKDWLAAGGLFLLGLSVYLFIPLRWPALHDGRWMTPGAFLRYVSGGQFHGALRLDGWQDPTRWRVVGRLLHQPFGWAGLALAAVGAAALALRRRRALALTGVTFAAFFLYGLNYYVADIAVFLLPAHLILAVWIGVGVTKLAQRLAAVLETRVPPLSALAGPAAVVLFALMPLTAFWTNLPAVDRSGDRDARAWGRYVLDQPLREGGAVLADPKRFAPLYYLQQVEGVRPDLDIILLGTEELYQAELRSRLGEGQPVYLARYLPHLDGLYLRSVGPLVEVGGEIPRPPVGPEEAAARFANPMQLLTAAVEGDPLGRALYHLTLHWWTEGPVDGDYVVRLRLVDAEGRVRWATEGARPVNGLYPTNAWRPDAPISDYHELALPPWLPPGRYTLQVGLFPPFGGEGLEVDGGSAAWLDLEELDVGTPSDPEPLARTRRVAFEGGTWLTGVEAPTEGAAGSPLTVELAWRSVARDERLRLAWVGGEGDGETLVAEQTVSLLAGMVRSRHTITAPTEGGAYELRAGLVGRTARCGWLGRAARGCPLAEVEVAAAREGLATFGDRVLLTSAEVGKQEAAPGTVLPVALRWRGLRAMGEDYTVFVHLVGPDGRLHGQVDSWPVQGSYPTSEWQPGKDVADRYEVRLDGDAPSGSYRVVVGLYRLETMERLRVLDETGKPVADSFVVGTFAVRE